MYVSPGLAIVKREFLSGLRNAKPFLFLMVLMLVMIGGLVFMLSVILDQVMRYGGAIGGGEVRMLFMTFSYGLYFSAILLVPPMAGVSICIEKQQDSYDLLRMTYIRPFSLAMAKLLNVLGIYALVTIATFPIIGVFFFLVGIDWTQFVQSFLVIMASALSCAVIGLLCSAWFYRTLPAIITTYIIGFLLHGGILLLFALLMETLWRYTWVYQLFNIVDEKYILALCPVATLAMIGQGYYSMTATAIALVYHGAIVAIGLKLTLVILNRPARPMKIDAERPIDDQAQLKARRKQFPYYLLDPRRRRPMIPDGKNPVFSKELQTGLLGRGTFIVRIFYSFTIFCILVSVFYLEASDFRIRNYGPFAGWPVFIDTIFILIVTPTLIATALAKEHEWGNLDMLRMTLLDPGQIVSGKFRTALYTAFIPMGATVVGCMPLVYFAHRSSYTWAGLASGFGSMLASVLFLLSLTLLVAVRCKRGVTGLMLGYGAGIAAFVLLPGAFFFWEVLATRGRGPDEYEAMAISFLSPILAQFANLSTVEEQKTESLLNLYWLANVGCFTAATALLVFLAKARFRRFLARGAG